MNLSSAIERALEEHSNELCLALEVPSITIHPQPGSEKRTTLAEQRKQQRRARRHECYERYERVVKLHDLGYTQLAISQEVGIERKTIPRWLRAGQFPERKAPSGRKSHVHECHKYVEQRWNEGCHNATRLFDEIQLQGYGGSRQMVAHHVSSWRTGPRSRSSTAKKRKRDRIAPRHADVLACRPAERLSEQHRALLEQVAINCATIRWMRALAVFSHKF